jgi:hypothetical protein
MKNVVAELKDLIESFNSRLDQAEERSMSWKTEHLKLCSQSSKNAKVKNKTA